ncbi:hypothetical protein LguiA_011519 [Lonicera macranthoides]
MPVKRSRIGRSSSFGETDLFNRVSSPIESPADCRREIRPATPSPSLKPPNNPAKVMKPSVYEQTGQSQQPRVLTLASPDQDIGEGSDQDRIGGFLEKCYYCGKKIRPNAEVFMYSYLRAFCTAECRDGQISLDKDMEKQSAKSEKMVGQSRGMINLKGHR